MRNKIEKTLAVAGLILGLLQLVLILLSWLLNAANGSSTAIRSMLSAEGIRWFFGHFADNLATPLLVWLILIAIALGTIKDSGIGIVLKKILTRSGKLLFREKIALYFVVVEFVVCIIVMLLLTVMPHALLLSASGKLFPSSFSYSFIPFVVFVAVLLSVSYGMMSGSINGLVGAFRAMSSGVAKFNYIWLLYVLAIQLYCSIIFVFTL